MRTWLKRMVAGIVSAGTLMGGGLLTAGTANADEIRMPDIGKTTTSTARTIAGKSNSLPTELVNGDFTYKGRESLDTARKAAGSDYQSDWNFANIDYVKGDAGAARKWAHIDGFQATGFGWKSNQTDAAVDGRAPIAEVQQSRDGSNYYGEITASQANTYLYQDIGTQHSSGTVYTVKLKHASRTLAMGTDSLQVLVGVPGHERPVELTRVASDGKDQVGEKSNVVASAVSGWDGKWDTYTGSVIIPADQPVTRFTFKSITGIDNVAGNLIDDVQFAYAYPLSYDANGGTKKQASRISSKTFGKASETDGKVKTVADDEAGSIPSNETAGAVKQAKSKTNGSVRLAADDDVAEYAANGLPDHLVNGDFEYPSMKSLQHYFAGIDRNRSQWISNGQGGDLAKWSDIPGGLDTTRFGWSSTQTQGAMSEQRANAVELQKATGETTQMGELCASQKGTAIYQDIATTPGTLYRIELDHASRYSIHLDQMQVMVGAPGHEQPVEMTRTSSNKYGDKIGETSTTIATHSTNPFGNQSSKDDFSHYVGYYTIPAGQSVTRFTFRQVSGVNTTSGNLLCFHL